MLKSEYADACIPGPVIHFYVIMKEEAHLEDNPGKEYLD
jgi:hypothetical protein